MKKYLVIQDVLLFTKGQMITSEDGIISVSEIVLDKFPKNFQELKEATLGERARQARKKARMTAKELGDLIDMSEGYVYNLEKSDDTYFKKNCSYDYLQELKKLGLEL